MANEPLKGHLDMLLLAALREHPTHGYAVIERLREGSGGVFDLPEGTIYPALHRLEHSGLLSSSWAIGETGRRRRVYALTAAGESALDDRRQRWEAFSGGIAGVLGAP
jgi:PadR family transcriptional regulator PadR